MPEAKICIVDDDPSVLRSLQELLSSDDLEAEAFDDPEKFLEYVSEPMLLGWQYWMFGCRDRVGLSYRSSYIVCHRKAE
jgi:DNA-binding NtrC family response regulator